MARDFAQAAPAHLWAFLGSSDEVGRARSRRRAGGADERRTFRTRLTWLNLAAGVLTLSVALLHAWVGLQVSRAGYELAYSDAVRVRLERELQDLSVEYAAARSPERLQREATTRLGFQRPALGQILSLPPRQMSEERPR